VSKPRQPAAYSRLALLAVALLLPAASLIPLGSLWLWERGYILHWAIATCIVVTLLYYLQKRLIVPLPASGLPEEVTVPADTTWRERKC
jgi:hypothetical protein